MNSLNVQRIKEIKSFPSLVKYLRDELDWPIESEDFEELTYEYEADELGIDAKTAAKIKEIKQLRPLSSKQPWGIFFINFEPKQLPIVVLRRILRSLVIKKRASANRAQQAAWQLHDLLFISSYGEDAHRELTFAHFSEPTDRLFGDLPTLRVLGWDDDDTKLKIDHVVHILSAKLRWPADENNAEEWRNKWSDAFELRPRQVITTSKELAILLAALAKSIRQRANLILDVESERGPLRKLHKAFQTALIHDLNEDDFADMYAQTIAYGLLAARVSRPVGIVADNLADMVPITNPFLKEMLGTFLTVGGRKGKIDFDELGIQEVVDLLNSPDTNVEAVLRDFGKRTMQEDPVVHFYELFLKEYDKKKKVERGVFYTPQPVVSYIVRSVHELLKTEFGIEDGLASTVTWGEMVKRKSEIKIPEGVSSDEPFVLILDIATGTATFLVEVIEVIHNAMEEKWNREGYMAMEMPKLWNEYVPKHLLPRLYGYELMMAPYAIAHMKIGLKLAETGYRFGSNERAHIYLTNSLEPPTDVAEQPQFEEMAPALAHEGKAVNMVKRNKRFTVVIGNPPYSNFGRLNKVPFILNLLDDYKRGLAEKKLNLDDDFIKFIRLSQRLIDNTGCGVLGFITNHTYLEGITHRQMRSALMASFDFCTFLDLHGSTKKDEQVPGGGVDENVFDITIGVSVALLVKHIGAFAPRVQHVELWGPRHTKYDTLSKNTFSSLCGTPLKPHEPFFFFVPKNLSGSDEYNAWHSMTEIFCIWKNGIQTDRDDLFFDFDNNVLHRRMQLLFSKHYDKDFKARYRVYASSSFAIEKRLAKTRYDAQNIKTCLYRPFDFRFLYYDPDLTSRPAFDIMQHLMEPNLAILCSRQQGVTGFKHAFCTEHLIERCAVSLNSRECTYVFPLYLKNNSTSVQQDLLAAGDRQTNLSKEIIETLAQRMGLIDYKALPALIVKYIYGLLYCPTYRIRYAEFLKSDFPRLPFTSNLELFRELVKFGSELVALHLMDSPKLEKHITRFIGKDTPEVEKISYSDDTVWIDKAKSQGFQGVPENVWNFHIGGYQVCEKWLKDRKGRTLAADDINHYHRIVVALSETIRIMAEIDNVIEAHGGWPDAFAGQQDEKKDTYNEYEESLLKAAEEPTPYENSENVSPKGEIVDDLPDECNEENDEINLQKAKTVSGTENDAKERLYDRIDDVTRADIMAVIREMFTLPDNGNGLERDDAIREISRALGFERTGPRIKEALGGDLIAAVRRGILLNEKGVLKLDCRTIKDYPRDLLKEYLLTAMGSTWWDQDDAIKTVARHLGFRRTGSVIQEAFKSVINGLLRQDILERNGNLLRRK